MIFNQAIIRYIDLGDILGISCGNNSNLDVCYIVNGLCHFISPKIRKCIEK